MQRTCTIDGCDRPHRARGLCGSHYNQTYQPNRHKIVTVPCTICGTPCKKYNSTSRRSVCSDRCRYYLTFGHWPETGKELIGPVPRRPIPKPADPISIPVVRFVSTSCKWCERPITWDLTVGGVVPRWCSKRCTRRAERTLRRAKAFDANGFFTWSEVMRIFLAHDRRCAYCHQTIAGQPDPDHVVPLSRGGSNSITNIVPCCRMCNCDKSNHLLAEWNADRARRGKPPVDVSLTEYKHLAVIR